MQKLVRVWQVGRISYLDGLKLQKHLVNLHHNNNDVANTILCLEHPPVYTTGIRTAVYSNSEAEKLKQLGAEFHRTDRGGLITFHGPGQLVVYPILNLKEFKASMRWYVAHIEKTVIHLCEKFGLKAETSPHTGVWINDKKVCAIGVHGSRFITSHGLAINCSTDLNWFNHIVPCGIEGKGVTSLSEELHRNVSVEEVVPMFLDSFCKIFTCNYTDFPKDNSKSILSLAIYLLLSPNPSSHLCVQLVQLFVLKMARRNPACCICWFLLYIFISYFIAGFCGFFYVFIYMFAQCCPGCMPYADCLLKGVQLPGLCMRKMCGCEGC